MPLLQGQPFRLTKPPDNIDPGTEVFVIQHTGEKFVNKSDYEDRLALYSQSIWSCQCSGKSGLTHQEAWTSEARVRILLASSFPEPLLPPILSSIHHSTLPLDQLIETALNLCHSQFHPGEELTLLGPHPVQVRVIRSKKDPIVIPKAENEIRKPCETPSTPLVNGCSTQSADTPLINGTSNGTGEEASPPTHNNVGSKETSPSHNNSTGGKGKEDSPSNRKKVPSLLPLLYDVEVVGEDRIQTDVPANLLQRTYRIPPKEHFRLLVRASAMRHRSSSYTPWLVSEDLVRQYNIPSKLASIFTNLKAHTGSRKRKSDTANEDRKKKMKEEKSEKSKMPDGSATPKTPGKPGRPRKRDPDAPRKKPGPKPGSKRVKKVQSSEKDVKKEKTEPSDSDDDISLAVLANRQTKMENGVSVDPNASSIPAVTNAIPSPGKRKIIKPSKEFPPKEHSSKEHLPKKMKQATLFDLKTAKNSSGTPVPRPSPRGRRPTAEGVMRSPTMKTLMSRYTKNNGNLKKTYYYIRMAAKRLSLAQIEVIPVPEIRDALIRRYMTMQQKREATKLEPEERQQFLKDTRRQWKELGSVKKEDKLLSNLKPLPVPQIAPTPEEIPNSLFGDIAMVVEFIECYQDLLKMDKKFQVSHSQLTQALAAGPQGFKYLAQIMCLLLHQIVADDRMNNLRELGMRMGSLPVHYQTASELARLCLKRHENAEEPEEQSELSDHLLNKLEHTELYELPPAEVLEILKALCHRVMDLDSTQDYVDELEEKIVILARHVRLQRNPKEKKRGRPRNDGTTHYNEDAISPKSQDPVNKLKRGRPRKDVVTLEEFYGKRSWKAQKEDNQETEKEKVSKENNYKEEENNESIRQEESEEKESLKQENNEDDNLKQEQNEDESLEQEEGKDEDVKEEESKAEVKEEIKNENVDEAKTQNIKKKTVIVIPARERSKRKTPEELQKEKEKKEEELRKQYEAQEEEKRQMQVKIDSQLARHRRDITMRIKPLGVDRNHDRYWLFNSTTPGLYVEKGWVDPNSDYNVQEPVTPPSHSCHRNQSQNSDSDSDDEPLSAIKHELDSHSDNKSLANVRQNLISSLTSNSAPLRAIREDTDANSDSDDKPLAAIKKNLNEGSDSDEKPLAVIKEKLTNSPQKGNPVICRKPLTEIERTETFPPLGQNMWFCYKSMDEVEELLKALNPMGIRESELITAIRKFRDQLQDIFTKEWPPLEELEDGPLLLADALRGDILQIEKELAEGLLGAVPDLEEWQRKTEQATSLQELGERLIEAQRHMNKKFLKNFMQCSKNVVLIQVDNPEECDLVEPAAVQNWRDAVMNCQTYSRMHLLVGMFDSCIKWEKSLASKKCKVCRQQGSPESPLAICDKCEVSYHGRCMRPPQKDIPPDAWLCPACVPSKKSVRPDRRKSLDDGEEGEEREREKVCRVCFRGLGLIFCSQCPAAYHSECHDPPLTSRARKDWECVDCVNRSKRKGRSSRNRRAVAEPDVMGKSERSSRSRPRRDVVEDSQSHKYEVEEPVDLITDTRRTSRRTYKEIEEDEDDDDDDDDESWGLRTRNTRNNKTRVMPRRKGQVQQKSSKPQRRCSRRSYKDSTEDDDDDDQDYVASSKGVRSSYSRNRGTRVVKNVKKNLKLDSTDEDIDDDKTEQEEEEEEEEEEVDGEEEEEGNEIQENHEEEEEEEDGSAEKGNEMLNEAGEQQGDEDEEEEEGEEMEEDEKEEDDEVEEEEEEEEDDNEDMEDEEDKDGDDDDEEEEEFEDEEEKVEENGEEEDISKDDEEMQVEENEDEEDISKDDERRQEEEEEGKEDEDEEGEEKDDDEQEEEEEEEEKEDN